MPRKAPYKPPYDVVAAVNPRAQTVTIRHVNTKDPDPKTFAVDSFTDIEVNGTKGTFKDLKRGMKVELTMGTDASRAERLVLTPAPPTPKTVRRPARKSPATTAG